MTTEQLSLAPGAGSGIGRKLADRLLARPDCLDLLESALLSALKAENRYFDKAANKMVRYPDAKTRLQAVMGFLAHMEGEPVKRILHFDATKGQPGDMEELAATLAASPALRSSVQRALKKAEDAARAETVDV
jgi:hypothetical protein